MSPLGLFISPHMYNRRQWRRLKQLNYELLTRWRKTFLSNLQARLKWTTDTINFKTNDIVLFQTDAFKQIQPETLVYGTNFRN